MLKELDLKRVRKRTIKNVYVGQEFKRKRPNTYGRVINEHFRIEAIYETYVRCTNLNNGSQECFTIGDLVTFGLEPEWDMSFGADPRGIVIDTV